MTGTQRTPNNAMGFTLPYGGLQHVATFDEVTPSMVNAALAGAKFLSNSFDKSKGELLICRGIPHTCGLASVCPFKAKT
jgi:hypothetical protein